MSYKHLTLEQRCIIFARKSSNISNNQIARELKVHETTILREIQRNAVDGLYNPSLAHNNYQISRKNSKKRSVLTPRVKGKVKAGLAKFFSPEQISGSLKKENINISHETIYKWIWEDKRQGGLLYMQLRRCGKKYHKRSSGRAGRGSIPNRVDISERPKIVDKKTRFGDFELDTIIGKGQKGAIVSIVERKTKYTLLKLVKNKTKKEVTKAIIDMLREHRDKVLTLTFDNGSEFADHGKIAKILKAECYFATPYHSWERGLNEHTNGLVRQFIPKKTDFRTLTQQDVAKCQNLLNIRPRKILHYETPFHMFRNSSQLALRC
jgi:IS30 family transposase